MTDKQPDALRLADRLEGHSPMATRDEAAALLRTQHTDLLRKDALLRQALEALASAGVAMRIGHMRLQAIDNTSAAIDAITKELQ